MKMTPQLLADLITTCFEGGSTWIARATPKTFKGAKAPWYAETDFYEDGKFVIVILDEDGVEYFLNQYNADVGLKKMKKQSQRHYKDLCDENWDADTADVWLQYSLFGEVVYDG